MLIIIVSGCCWGSAAGRNAKGERVMAGLVYRAWGGSQSEGMWGQSPEC